MSIDMRQFVQIFLEEASEHLAALESGLLGIDLAQPDAESLNSVFRAAHSIKGGAGTFGFSDMADFTHTLETLLDHVRRNEILLDDARLDACLRAVDVLREMLDGHRNGIATVVAGAEELSAELARLAQTGNPPAAPGRSSPAVPEPARRSYRISIDIPPHAGVEESTLVKLLDTLSELGTLEFTRERTGSGTDCWRMTLDSDSGADELADFISYLLAPEWIRVEALEAATVTKPGPAAADEDGYGFFDPLPASAESADDASFGFFEPLPAATPAAGGHNEFAADEGFGFFEPLPLSPRAAPDSAAAFTALDGASGFRPLSDTAQAPDAVGRFEPLEDPADGADDDAGYGFFEALPSARPPALTAIPPARTEAETERPQTPATALAPAANAQKIADTQRDRAATAASDANSIRVGITKVDQLINLVGELVITQSMLLQSADTLDPVLHERLLGGLAQLERNSRDLQEAVMSVRMVPMSFVFSRYPRMVRDLARKLDKQAELQLVGESTELDNGMIEKIVDPLTHLVRNAVDHGLESTAWRLAAGKPAIGLITLSAAHQSGQILIEISDDGAGLDRQRILAKAARQGMSLAPDVSDGEVWDLIFAPGFSTAEEITDVSGRGVGMDVVRKNIQALGGSVQLASVAGRGTRVSIRLPLTLAILDGMSVRAGNETFIVPLGFVIESLHASALEFHTVGRDGRVVRVRDEYLPVVSLAALFEVPAASREIEQAVLVVLEAEDRRVALAVDALLGQHQVVVKNLETNFRRVPGISGATILGDGQVSLILDVGGLIRMAHPESATAAA